MQPLLPVLRALRDADVSFVVVGGVAVALQGHPRSTVDLDPVIDFEVGNAGRAGWVEHRNLTVFSLHDPDDPRREVHVLAHKLLSFDQVRTRARRMQGGDVAVAVVSRQDLTELRHRAWLSLTAAQRLEWLEEMLDLAAASGALDADRARRAEEARRAWEQDAPA